MALVFLATLILGGVAFVVADKWGERSRGVALVMVVPFAALGFILGLSPWLEAVKVPAAEMPGWTSHKAVVVGEARQGDLQYSVTDTKKVVASDLSAYKNGEVIRIACPEEAADFCRGANDPVDHAVSAEMTWQRVARASLAGGLILLLGLAGIHRARKRRTVS